MTDDKCVDCDVETCEVCTTQLEPPCCPACSGGLDG